MLLLICYNRNCEFATLAVLDECQNPYLLSIFLFEWYIAMRWIVIYDVSGTSSNFCYDQLVN